MNPDYTPAVTRALEAARRWAQSSGSEAVQPLHLLLGLLDEEEGRVATVLVGAGLDLAAVRAALGGPAVIGSADAPLPQLGAGASQVLHEAQDFVGALSVDSTLTTEQVLLALLHGDESLRGRLESHGLSWERLQGATAGAPLRLEETLPVEESLQLADVTERMHTARILDAGFNRAREALRVIEDYCRFVLDDVFLSAELK